MTVTRSMLVTGVFFLLASLPLFGVRKTDVSNSMNGSTGECKSFGPCLAVAPEGSLTLTDPLDSSVSVTIALYDWGQHPCNSTSCNLNSTTYNSTVIDVTLTSPDSTEIESLVVRGSLSNPGYVNCGGNTSPGFIGCVTSPEPDEEYVQEPTPIASEDIGTRWDFGNLPGLGVLGPGVPFSQIQCLPGTGVCTSGLGEAILTVSNSVAANHLTADASNFTVTFTDGGVAGGLSIPANSTKQVVNTNNTQKTAIAITNTVYTVYMDASQAYPLMDQNGDSVYLNGYMPPVPPGTFQGQPCYPTNASTGETDTRTFRSAWWTYTAPSDGSITILTGGSRYDTLIYVFTESNGVITSVACDDDPYMKTSLQAAVTFKAVATTPPTPYQVVVYETPTLQPAANVGYPLSVDSELYFKLLFSTTAPTTTTALKSSQNPSTFGKSVTFTATVTSKLRGTITGTVTFKDGTTTLGTPVALNSAGVATFATKTLSVGTHSITARYSGDSNFNSSMSAVLSQVVNQ
jgi:hypothetical protein